MRAPTGTGDDYQQPALLTEAKQLAKYVTSLDVDQLAASMHLSHAMAGKTQQLWQFWTDVAAQQLPAIDAFLGDIYSGLQVQTFTAADRAYANEHLYILSGLYGVLRALDSITPYRLEMGYRLPDEPYRNLYVFWADKIANQLPANQPIINLSAVEYTKAVLPYMPGVAVITPKFMTIGKTGQPVFVTVHAKVARGAFARWLIQERVTNLADVVKFTELNYRYDATLSTPEAPVFVCRTFGGIGLSVRLTPKS